MGKVIVGLILASLIMWGGAHALSNHFKSHPNVITSNLEMPKLPNGSNYGSLTKSGGISKTIGAGTSVNL
jgi:hypothetical protein